MKDQILPNYPRLCEPEDHTDMDTIREKGYVEGGANGHIGDIAHHAGIRERYTALARRPADALPISGDGDPAGNICQDIDAGTTVILTTAFLAQEEREPVLCP